MDTNSGSVIANISDQSANKYNPLVYGKNPTEGIVGLECKDGEAELFIQEEGGSVSSVIVPHKYWLLASEKLDKNFVRLEGDLNYKWGRQFSERSELLKWRSIYKTKDIYSVANAEEAMMIKDGYTFYKGLKLKDVSLLSFDIETTGLDGYAEDAKILLISTTFRDVRNVLTNHLFSYDDYSTEKELIDAFCNYVVELDPSLIIGHNILSYDFPYMAARADINGTTLNLGRNGSAIRFNNYESKFRLDGTRELLYKNASIYGREIVDTYFLSVSFDVSKSIETYALKPMIKQLGFEKEGRQYYDAGSIRDNYKNPKEWELIKQYAIDDAEDPVKLWDYMGPLYFNMAPMIPKPLSEILLSASGSKLNALMVRAYLQDRHSIPKASEVEKFEGALSWAKSGVYSNCFKIDLASLYPSIMLEYEVYDSDKDPKGYLLQLVKTFREKRLEYKKLAADTGDSYWKEMDTTAKGILNSFYGFMGAPGLPFNSPECAAFITEKGREILKFTYKWASGKNFEDEVKLENAPEENELSSG